MEVITRGAASGVTLFWGRGQGWVLTVVCKTAFDLVPGEAVLRDEAPAPSDRDIPWDAPYARSLRAASDLVPMKPRVDVLVTGHAYAPAGRAVRALTARLVVGGLDKSIDVATDRYFDRVGVLVDGAPFAHMPLVYERAAGGPGTWNLAGRAVGQRDARGHIAVPNILPHGQQLLSPDQLFVAPAGFGPIPGDWPSRVERLGRRSLRDVPARWHGQPLPDDFPREYFNAAPPDQQLTAVPDDLVITLEHLHAVHASLTCRIPQLRPTITCEAAGSTANIVPRVDTIHVDTDAAVCTLVWRGHLPLRDHREATRVTIALDAPARARRKPTFTGVERVLPIAEPAEPVAVDDSPFDGTLAPGLVSAAALPFPNPPPRGGSSLSQSWSGGPPQGSLSQSWSGGPPPVPAPPPRPARDPLSQSWSGSAPAAPRPAEQSSPSWQAIEPGAPRPSLGQSGSWRDGVSGPADQTMPPLPSPPMAPPLPVSPARTEPAPPMAVAPVLMPAPVPVPPPAPVPIAAFDPGPAVGNDSPWASGSATAKRETIGMAATSGALALSDPKYEPLPVSPVVAAGAGVSLQLLWFDPDHVARIRRVPAWKEHLDAMEREPLDRGLDDSGTAREPWEIEDRREVFEVLARGALSDVRGVEDALAEARRPDGKLVAPLVLVEMDIEVQLDELEGLKAAATTAAPLITPSDEGLRAAVEAADQFLARPSLSVSPQVCTGLHTRIREAFVREKKGLPADYLDRETERALLSGRRYQKRSVLGGVYLRAFGWMPGEKEPIVTYLPESLATKLPMYRRFGARVIGNVHSQQDQYETRGLALRGVAVGRRG